ncbi:MAG: hypothetical protein WCL14_11835 [Bacteroidota bacterium]
MNIDPEKIIHILLKHLMMQQNEIAYMKNKEGLLNDFSVNALKKDSSIRLSGGISDLGDGSKRLSGGISDLGDGSKQLYGGIPDLGDGSKQLYGGIPDLEDGSKRLSGGISDLGEGSKQLYGGIPDLVDGSKQLYEGITDIGDGSKQLFEGIPLVEDGSKHDAWLYSYFEEELIKELEQYIKNGNGWSSVFDFYVDFMDAVAKKNAADSKRCEMVISLKLEDTHTLPLEIKFDTASIGKLSTTIRGCLQQNASWDMAKKIACEFLLLHNSGKANITELRKVTGFSEGGLAKQLPKMQRKGWIKKVPPKNYALTETSRHILLETFGILKTMG